jgi:hypothetical protein
VVFLPLTVTEPEKVRREIGVQDIKDGVSSWF